MVGKVLTGITRCEKGSYALVGGVAEGFCAAVELSDSERDELLQLCRQRLDAFRKQRGEEVFAPRSRHRTPDQRLDQIPGSPMRQGPLRVLRRGLLLSKLRTSGPWRG